MAPAPLIPRRSPTPRVAACRPTQSFDSAEQAWFWFWQCQIARDDGARFVADAGRVARPCDPDDLWRAALGLLRRRRIDRRHLRVLSLFGRRLTPPDPRLAEEAIAARLWDDGLDRLSTPLRAKGIVA